MLEMAKVLPLRGSETDIRMRRNAKWLLSLDVDRFLASIRENCGLDTRGAKSYGGWSNYYYHYLRAMCNLYTSFKGSLPKVAEEARKRALQIAHGLAECQKATGTGMITPAMDKSFEDRTHLVRDSIYSHTHIEAIMYVVHKVMFGLITVYNVFGDNEALETAEKMADRVYELMAPYTHEQHEQMTNSRRASDFFSEAGGIMQGFIMLYEATGKEKYLKTSEFFRRTWFDRMFTEDDDKLAWGMEHANSESPYVESLMDRYLTVGDESALAVVRGFMEANRLHELPNGSLSGRSAFQDYQAELYNYPKRVFFHIMNTPGRPNVQSGESCCAHNMNRIAKKLMTIEPDARIADDWERRYINAVLAQQNIDTGMFIYNQNLKSNAFKMWGYPDNSFWCCYGTGAEEFASLTDGAFYEDKDKAYACLYMPCEYVHSATGMRITENTAYPDDGKIEFTFRDEGDLKFMLRIPGWLKRSAKLTLPTGETLEISEKQCFYEIERHWNAGDVLTLELPFDLHAECMPDRAEYLSLRYGPNLEVLCATEDYAFNGTIETLLSRLKPTGENCTFATEFTYPGGSMTRIIKPFRRVKDETYCGYIHVIKAPKEQLVDVLRFDDEAACEAHKVSGVGMRTGEKNEKTTWFTSLTFFSEPGEIRFDMDSDPENEMQLRLYLDGDAHTYIHQFSGHIVNPLFDLEVLDGDAWQVFSTKSMEADYPGKIYYENFVVPEKWTRGKNKLSFRLKARNFHDIPGVIETLVEKIELFKVPQSAFDAEIQSNANSQAQFLPNSDGLC